MEAHAAAGSALVLAAAAVPEPASVHGSRTGMQELHVTVQQYARMGHSDVVCSSSGI